MLQNDVAGKHNEAPRFPCKDCKISVKWKSSLNRHMTSKTH